MSTTTTRLNLTKPENQEYYSLAVWNTNMDNIDSKVALLQKQVSISLPTASWVGSVSPYSQTITITGSKATTKVDLTPNASVITQMLTDKTSSIYVENNNGTLTAYAIGAKPTANLTISAVYYDIEVEA